MHIGNPTLIAPILYLSIAAIAVLMLGVVASRKPQGRLEHYLPAHYLAPALTFPALMLAGLVVFQSLVLADRTVTAAIGGQLVRIPAIGLFVTAGGHAQLTVDPFAAIFSFVAIAGALIVMLLSIEHFGENQRHKGEYYALLMFATVAASIVAAASDLIAIYPAIEFLSMTSYVLAAYAKTDRRSGEAGLKYFLYGAACSAIMLYGMSIIFGVSGGSTALSAIARTFLTNPSAVADVGAAGWVGIVFVLVGLGFKIALVPFHFWAPDAYEGAPTPVTAFLSVVSKAAGLAVLVRFLIVVAGPMGAGVSSWYWILVALTAASMFYGNLVAIPQRNIKRMLAYSSIAQIGYMMVGVLAGIHAFGAGHSLAAVRADVSASVVAGRGLPWEMQGVLTYVMAYLVMNLGAFAVVTAVGRRLGSEAIEDYAGLAKRSPFYACALTVFLISLAGVPPTAGFLAKFFVFGSAIRVGIGAHPELVVLAVLGIINSVISAYYYLNVVRLMFFAESESEEPVRGGFAVSAAIVVTLVLTLAITVLARPVSELTGSALYASLIRSVR